MPRAARPQGNRTDLLVGGPNPNATAPGTGQPNGQPVKVPTGLPYGENQQLQQAQQAVPLPAQGTPPPAPTPQQPPNPQQAIPAAQQFQMPQLGALERPTERPGEPVTAGLPGFPGSAPPPSAQGGGLADMLGRMAAQQPSAALSQLAQRAQALAQ